MKGYCDKKGKPITIPWLTTLDAHILIEKFNAVMNGLQTFM
jgi:hypothetical protein